MFQDKRRSKRFASRIGMVFRDNEGLNFSFITNISRYGIYLETERVLAPGSKVNFYLSNSVARVPVEGKVVRIKDAAFEGPPSGMGINFENLDHTAKSIRDDIILYLMNLQYQRVWVGEQPIEEAI